MYEPLREEEAPGCRETWVLTRAVCATLLPVLLVLIGVLALVAAAFVLFALHPALVLAPIGVLAAALLVFARWERSRVRPPEA